MVALLSHPDMKLRKISRANNTPIGNPIANCLKKLFCLSLFADQYATKRFSSSVNIRKFTSHELFLQQGLKIIILCT